MRVLAGQAAPVGAVNANRLQRRPLPAFQQLHNVLLGQFHTRWYGDREHEWAAESAAFRRYSLNESGPWGPKVIEPRKER